MSDTVTQGSLCTALDRLEAAVDALQALDLTRDTDADVLDGLRALERVRNRLDCAGYGLINDAGRRGLPHAFGCRSMGRLLRHLLRIDAGTARVRAAAAEAAGPRIGLTGEKLEPVFAHVAAGQAAGTVSQRQAGVIVSTIEAWPGDVQAEHGEQAERDLVAFAARLDPAQLGQVADRITAHVHPDGDLDPERAESTRSLHLDDHRNGTSTPRGLFGAELTERLKTYFDVAAAPKAAAPDGTKDMRSLGQRQHDALCDLLEQAVRWGEVPSNNGVSATIVIHVTEEQFRTRSGVARTGHGAIVPAAQALSWSGGDSEVFAVVLNAVREVTRYGATHRIFTEKQHRVIAARDRGCTFPGCPESPGRCQTDHVQRYEDGGPTSIANGALECRYHHREHRKLGWQPVMIDGLPYWIPPPWVDPSQTPQRNTLHDDLPAA